jgi:hypothetical protein
LQLYTGPEGSDVYLAINDPAFVLWSKPRELNIFRAPEALKWGFPEWLRGASYNTNPDVWVKDTLKGVRPRLDTSQYGVFTPAFPTVKNDIGSEKDPGNNGDGVAVTRYFGLIKKADRPPHPFSRAAGSGNLNDEKAFGEAFANYNKLLSTLATIAPQNVASLGCDEKRCNGIALSGGNDVVMPGWIGNAQISTGPGDDVILASPQVNVAAYFGSTGSGAVSPYARVYYPTPYALRGGPSNRAGNLFSGGTGNDVIYYDGSVAAAYGDDGDDILAPSFGSFNWAFDTLLQGVFSRAEAERYAKNPLSGIGPPLNVYRSFNSDARNWGRIDWLVGVAQVSGPKALLGPDTDLRRGLNTPSRETYFCKQGCPDSYVLQTDKKNFFGGTGVFPFNIGLNGAPASGKPQVDKEINKLGGQDLYGGAGDDVIYGIDPDFYKGFQTAANGKGIRVAFNMPKDGKVDGRQHAQVFQSVNMFGGAGSDYFSLGNPGNLDAVSQSLDSLYRISGNSDSWKLRDTADFGVLEGDVFEANLTYQGANWTSSVVAPGDGQTVGATVGKAVKGGADAVKVVKDLAGLFDKDSKLNILFTIPKLAAVASVVSFVTGLIQGYTPTPEEPIADEGPLYSDPIGSWRKTIKIQDWDPADSIAIRVDPSNSQSDLGERWNNVLLELRNKNSTAGEGLYITYKLTGNPEEKDLFLLENFTAKDNVDGAWWAWDFRQAGNTGAYVKITDKHLGFFGQVDPSKASLVPSYDDVYRFNVAAGSTQFRWADEGLKNNTNKKLLNTLRSNSERIVIQLDTMSLGYHWDIRYTPGGQASGPNDVLKAKVDEKLSKLWVVNPNPDAPVADRWIGYSLEDLKANPELAKLAKKATPVWAGPRVNPNGAVT